MNLDSFLTSRFTKSSHNMTFSLSEGLREPGFVRS